MPDGSLAPQLIEKPRASRAPKRPEPIASPLSVEAIARQSLALGFHSEEHYFRQVALRDQISALPARTLPDAVAQIGLILTTVNQWIGDQDTGDLMQEDLATVLRLAASVLPVIAAASGMNPAELVEEWCINQWDRHFGAIDQVMGDAA